MTCSTAKNGATVNDSFGYTYAKNGSVIQSVSIGYDTDDRINSAGFLHGGEMKQFGYEYLLGTNLLHKLTKPNGMTLTQSYEAQRDLLTGMAYHRGSTLVMQREYTYDVLSRPTARTTSRQGTVVNDTFVHNSRSELASAQVNGETYGYDYDNVGNRRMSMEAGDYAFYEANELNQYSDITGSEDEADFSITPVFDADGNQTLIKTDTGIWSAVYNAENRPISFLNEATGTVVECAYDSMGRRCFKKVTVNGTVTLHQRYLYRGYLQNACIDLTRSHHPGLWLITWDPTQPIATRPLAIQKDGTWYTYGLDLTKNVCEVFGSTGYIASAYTYSPYGSVTATGNVTQPIQWSSEFNDEELGLVYYNWRYYNTQDGKWLSRDLVGEFYGENLYSMVMNSLMNSLDLLGGNTVIVSGGINTDLDEDPNHDKNWRNFILAAKKQFYILNETCTEEKEWFVNKSSYLERANNELIIDTNSSAYKTAQQVYSYVPDYSKTIYRYIFDQIRPVIRVGTARFSSNAHGNRESFIKEIESSAQELGVTLRWFDSKRDFLHNLKSQPNGKPRKECSKIKRFYYYGHGYIGKLAIIYNKNEGKSVFINASDFSIRDFNIPSLIKLETWALRQKSRVNDGEVSCLSLSRR